MPPQEVRPPFKPRRTAPETDGIKTAALYKLLDEFMSRGVPGKFYISDLNVAEFIDWVFGERNPVELPFQVVMRRKVVNELTRDHKKAITSLQAGDPGATYTSPDQILEAISREDFIKEYLKGDMLQLFLLTSSLTN